MFGFFMVLICCCGAMSIPEKCSSRYGGCDLVVHTLALYSPPPVLACWRIKIDIALSSCMTLHPRHQTYTDAIPATYLYHSIPTPPEPHHQAPLRMTNLARLSAQLSHCSVRSSACSQPNQAGHTPLIHHIYIMWHCALLPWRTNSGMNPQVIPVRHSQQSVSPSTSSGSTAQHNIM